MAQSRGYKAFCLTLLGVFLLYWGALAIAPYDRHDWLLENLLVFLFLPLLLLNHRRLPLSRISYGLIFLYACLHSLGAHYTYVQVPYDAWGQAILGFSIDESLGLTRNSFDRFVHFSYGLLIAYPVREIFFRMANARGFWSYFLPLDIVMSTSMIFELLEWGVVEVVASDLGVAYLGTQGDVWDAHKDMALASLGALLAMAITVAINARLQRDFAREWHESLRVKYAEPLGEVKIARYLNERD